MAFEKSDFFVLVGSIYNIRIKADIKHIDTISGYFVTVALT